MTVINILFVLYIHVATSERGQTNISYNLQRQTLYSYICLLRIKTHIAIHIFVPVSLDYLYSSPCHLLDSLTMSQLSILVNN